MNRPRILLAAFLAAIICSASLISFAAKVAAAPPDPLRLVPPVADFVVKIEKPRAIADLVLQFTGKPELAGFRGYRDYIGSTNYQLFRQLVAHFEHELGHSWPELLDRVAGGGIVLAVKFVPKQTPPVLVIVQGTDAKLTERFFRNLREVVADEQARQGATDTYKSDTYRGIETFQVGENLYAAALGAALVYSNMPQALHLAIDQHLDPAKPSLLGERSLAEGRPLVPDGALAWAWLKLDYARQSPEAKQLFQLPSTFFPEHVLFGGFLDVARRSPCIVASVQPAGVGLALSVAMPRGTSGMGDLVRAHVPPPGQPGALPLLCPEGTLYSSSLYLDLAEFWKQRAVLFPAELLKQFEAGDKRSELLLQGTRFSQFLELAGTRHRIVVARQDATGYSSEGETHYPAYGWVFELRSPDEFERAIEKPLAGAAFLVGFQVPLKAIDENYHAVQIRGVRFVENDANKARNGGVLFNYSPCRARVGNQYIVGSTLELTRKLVDAVKTEAAQKESSATTLASPAGVTTMQSRLVWGGVSNYLGGIKKQLIVQNMLEQGNTQEAAAKEITLFLNLIDQLGKVETTTRMEANRYEFTARFGL